MTDERTGSPSDAEVEERLAENAFRELQPGETYQPVIPVNRTVPEVTVRSVIQGIFWSVVFSAAATYIALKLGQGIESAIPISILAVGFSALITNIFQARASTLIENVNVLAIGATSGIVAGGSVFTMPAIYILDLQDRSSILQIFLVPLLGACLGVFFLAPFRRYFVRDLHGKLPFPEGRATTEILMAGKRGGRSAIVLSYSAIAAAIFDFLGPAMRAWADVFSTESIGVLNAFTRKTKAIFTMNTSAAVLGLGYIMGLDYALMIMAGSVLAFLILVPLFPYFGPWLTGVESAALAGMSPQAIFGDYVRKIGIGGIFAAGIFSILKMSPTIVEAVRQAAGELRRLARGGTVATPVRTEDALPMSQVLGGIAILGLAVLVYFRFSVLASASHPTAIALVATAMTLGIAFLFAAVSAWAIAMISITPISGMTLTTLIVTAVVLSTLGLSGPQGQLQTLLVGGVVCTALSMSGSLVTQYKIGYWLGATPRRIEISNLIGSVIASAATTIVILLMAKVYGFVPGPTHPHALPAPQPNVMADVLRGAMGTSGVPWGLYGVGAVCAIAAQILGVSGLAFAMGMYLPMELNSPLVLGAAVAWLLKRSSKNEGVAAARHEKGTLIASGFIAGGALVGVFTALLRYLEDQSGHPIIRDLTTIPGLRWLLTDWGNWLGLLVFVLLAAGVYWDSHRERREG